MSRRIAVAVAGALWLALVPAAQAAQRYAAPAGSGTACSAAQPCAIDTAVVDASGTDEVIVGPGDYGSEATPITITMFNNDAISVHGADGQPRPRIFTAAPIGLQLTDPGASLRWIEIRYLRPASVVVGCELAGTIDSIVVRVPGFGVACGLRSEGGSVHNSVFVAANAEAITLNGAWTLRGVTARSLAFAAVRVGATSGVHTAAVTNSILQGGAGADVVVRAGAGASASVVLEHSNYDAASAAGQGGAESVTPPGSGANQTAAPLFVDAANGDLRQGPGSPTLDAGINSALNGPTDADGKPRTLHGRTDIGADERIFAPDAVTGGASGVTPTAATVAGVVTPWDFGASWRFDYGTTTAYGSQTADTALAAGATGQPALATFTGLTPSTTYHFRLVATGLGGTSTGQDQTFTTAPSAPAGSGSLEAREVRLGVVRAGVPRRRDRVSIGARLRLQGAAPSGWKAALCGTVHGSRRTGRRTVRRRAYPIGSCAARSARPLRAGMRVTRVFACRTLRQLRSRRLVIRVRVYRPDGSLAFEKRTTSRRAVRLCAR